MKTLTFSDLGAFGLRVCFFLTPVVLVVASYFISDPFKVIYPYDDYYNTNPPMAALNRGYVSTELYLRNHKKYHYDSFIFGSSRSLAYLTTAWQPYIGKKSSPFHWDSSGESLFGIWGALKLVDSMNAPLANALLIVDPVLLAQVSENEEMVFIHHPAVSGLAKIKVQWLFFRKYLSKGFCIRYWDLKLFKTERPYMKNYVYRRLYGFFNPVTNECPSVMQEALITANPEKFYSNRRKFYPVKISEGDGENKAVLAEKQIAMLRDINAIFLRKKTNFKIVISPLYDQRKINHADLQNLQDVFGKDNVYDFSGSNEITKNIMNYKDPGHYRIPVGNFILEKIYAEK